jgi:hypothetical protein
MAHFAKIENGIVTQVNRIDEDYFYANRETRYTETWIQTSYNTKGGVHYNPETGEPSVDQSKALRKNYAGIGFTYDEERDAFIPPKTYESWILNETTCLWESPIPYPNNDEPCYWDEQQQQWIQLDWN